MKFLCDFWNQGNRPPGGWRILPASNNPNYQQANVIINARIAVNIWYVGIGLESFLNSRLNRLDHILNTIQSGKSSMGNDLVFLFIYIIGRKKFDTAGFLLAGKLIYSSSPGIPQRFNGLINRGGKPLCGFKEIASLLLDIRIHVMQIGWIII